MKKTSGIFLLNKNNELLITHPTNHPREHSWSVPKGEPDVNDDSLLTTALREFYEETGLLLPIENICYLGSRVYKSNKKMLFAFFIKDESMSDEDAVCNSTFSCFGKTTPENDEFLWISIYNEFQLKSLLHESQIDIIDHIITLIKK